MNASDFLDGPDAESFLDDKPVKKNVNDMKAPSWARNLAGAPEAALSMVAGLPSQIAGGLLGLGTFMSGQGIDKAGTAVRKTQESNFGFGSFEGITGPGKEATKNVGELLQKPLDAAEEAGGAVGGALGNENLGRLSGRLPAEVLMNFLPLHFGMKGLTKSPKKVDVTKESVTDRLGEMNKPVAEAFLDETPVSTEKAMTPSQLKDWVDRQEKFKKYQEDQAALVRQQEAQAVVEARQRAIEQEVAQRASLDMNAAERARQEQAPTGYAEWVEAQRNNVAGDQGVNNPIAWPRKVADRYPEMTTDLPGSEFKYEGAIDPGINDQRALPIEIADTLQSGVRNPDPFDRVSYRQNANRMAEPLEREIAERQRSQGLPDELTRMADEGHQPITPKQSFTTPEQSIPRWKGEGGKFGQRGGIDFNEVTKAARNLSSSFSKMGTKIGNVLTPQEQIIFSNLGDTSYIPRGDRPDQIITESLKSGKDSADIFKDLESGLAMSAEKSNSPLQRGVSRHLAWAEKTGNKYFRDYVKPLEVAFKNLSVKELTDLMAVLKLEMFDRQKYTPEQLKQAGLSEKQLKVYTRLRDTFDDAMQRTNESRLALGQDPITPASAYLSSQWTGNWHMPVYDKNGKLVWYVKAESKGEANKAAAWFKKNQPDYVLKPVEYKPSQTNLNIPKDVSNVYTHMMKTFEGTPIADEISAIMNRYKEERDFSVNNFKVHFENKSNVRGFLGDKPWLSEKENAHGSARAQTQYLKDAYRWAPLQEALVSIKEVLNNPELNSTQPNNIAISKAYTANAMGLTDNMFRQLENYVAKGMHTSPGVMRGIVGDLKSWTYLTQLGMSPGYMIATPLQAFVLGPALHAQLSGQGVKHNVLKTGALAVTDTAKILRDHAGIKVGQSINIGKLSEFGKEAQRYAEDNGLINIDLFDEAADLGQHAITDFTKETLGVTISAPEKVARIATFMSFAHHLNASGMYKNKLELFRKAEELTDQTLTKFSRSGRPLIVDKLGLAGELAYTYKSPILNYYNNMANLVNDGNRTGNWRPLLTALTMTYVLGGALGVPGVQELDGLFELFKNGVAKAYPQYAADLDNVGVKQFIAANLPDIAAYGAVSAATGAQMTTRFSTQIMDITNPMGDLFPAASTVGNVLGLANPIRNPNETTFAQSAYDILPPAAKGMLETTADTFKSGERDGAGRQGYYNPSRLEDRQRSYNRTEEDEKYRKWGLTSLEEARAKDMRYINSKENKIITEARNKSMTKLFDAVVRKDKDDIEKYAEAYINNYGDQASFDLDFKRAVTNSVLTPEQRDLTRANTRREIESVLRRQKLDQK